MKTHIKGAQQTQNKIKKRQFSSKHNNQTAENEI
jgi:hypothetical protein